MSLKRKHDVSESTPQRMVATLDILDDYPFLSKQLQAASALRNLDLEQILYSVMGKRENVFTLLTNILTECFKRFLSDEMDLVVVERNDSMVYSVTRPGHRETIEWYEAGLKQPFAVKAFEEICKTKSDEKYYLRRDLKDSLKPFVDERDKWLSTQPEVSEEVMRRVMDEEDSPNDGLNIIDREVEKFIKRYKEIVNKHGGTFYIYDYHVYDYTVSFIVTDRELPYSIDDLSAIKMFVGGGFVSNFDVFNFPGQMGHQNNYLVPEIVDGYTTNVNIEQPIYGSKTFTLIGKIPPMSSADDIRRIISELTEEPYVIA